MKNKLDQNLKKILTRFRFGHLAWVAALVGLFAMGLLMREYRSWQNVFQTHIAMIYNITQAREYVAEAQIRLWKVSTGAGVNKIEEVLILFEQAEQLIDDSITGKGNASFLSGSPLTDDPALLFKLKQMKTIIARSKDTAEDITKKQKKIEAGKKSPPRLNKLFGDFNRYGEAAKNNILRHIDRELEIRMRDHIFTVGVWIIIVLIICGLIFSYGKKQQLIRELEISEKKAAEELARHVEELKRSNEELQQFAYVASHDLQEPLRMVSSYTSLLGRRYKGKLDSKADLYIEYAVDGANRMQRLINDLLSYSRIGTRGEPMESTDCKEVMGAVLVNLQKTIEENNAIITNDTLPTVKADASQICLLFQNLICNAVKFHSDVPPRIHISSKRENGCWVFSVRDNGIGIDPEYKDRIFDMFKRLHSKNEYPGTGIGLANCKKIINRHGGEIWVESKLEKGSVFNFTIPVIGGEKNESI